MAITWMLVFSLIAGACGDSDQFVARDMPKKAADPAITELLPIGPHMMELELDWANEQNRLNISATGYIDLPANYDLYDGCSFDLKVTTRGYEKNRREHIFRKAAGAPAWRQTVSDDIDVLAINEWFDWDDPMFYVENRDGEELTLFPELVWLPAMLGAQIGTDSWCNLRRIDQLGTISDSGNGHIKWSSEGFAQVQGAYLDAWVLRVLTVDGLKGSKLTKAALALRDPLEFFVSIPEDLYLAVSGDKQERVFVTGQPWSYDPVTSPKPLEITIRFTPTERRDVSDVPEGRTYLQKLEAGDVDASDDSVTEMLLMLRG
jgi:hypothetical protein